MASLTSETLSYPPPQSLYLHKTTLNSSLLRWEQEGVHSRGTIHPQPPQRRLEIATRILAKLMEEKPVEQRRAQPKLLVNYSYYYPGGLSVIFHSSPISQYKLQIKLEDVTLSA